MNISSAIFDCSSPDLDGCPDESLPEFAFIGRSNVGKSSLLNFLTGTDRLARVSPTPGFTKLINFFTINGEWRLVDLPGYGFAEGSYKQRSQFNKAVSIYLKFRPNLCCIFLLIDSGLPPQPLDLEFIQWLAGHRLPFVIVFTKTDRERPEVIDNNIAAFTEQISRWFQQLPEMYRCSAVAGTGRSELLAIIDATVKAGPAEEAAENEAATDAPPPLPEVEEPFKLEVRAGTLRDKEPRPKKKLKGARPW